MTTQLLRSVKSLLTVFILILMLMTHNNWSYTQCSGTFPEPDCSTIVAPEIFEGVVIGAGQTYVVSTPIVLNSITLAGGQLIVCSDITLNTVSFNGGNLLVASGGSVNVTNGGAALVLGPNSVINNYGTITLACSIVTGPDNIIANCINSSVFAVPFNQIVIQGPNSQFVNNGQVQSSFIVNTSSNTIIPWCLGAGSQTVTGIMINQYNIGFTVPEANACLNVTNFMSNSEPLTDTDFLSLCYDSSTVTISGAPNFGNATVLPNNPSCNVALGYTLSLFTGKAVGRDVQLSWNLDVPLTSIDRIVVLKHSRQTGEFEALQTLQYAGENCHSTYTDPQALSGEKLFYRLKVITVDNETEYSDIVKIDSDLVFGSVFYPNPFNTVLYCSDQVEIKQVYTLDAKPCTFHQENNTVSFEHTPKQGLIIIYEIKGKRMIERVLTN